MAVMAHKSVVELVILRYLSIEGLGEK